MSEAKNLLIEIIRHELNDIEPSEEFKALITEKSGKELYEISKKHDLAHIVSRFLYRNALTDRIGETAKAFSAAEMLICYRAEQQKYCLPQIIKLFNSAEIPFVLLKGSVLKEFYPYEAMRTSCDIDVLVHKEDLERATEALLSAGYKKTKENYHDISFFSPAGVIVELHFSLTEHYPKIDGVLEKAWEYCSLKEKSQYELSKEFFVFHFFAHMMYHFVSGGCGIKTLMDLWIIENKIGLSLDTAKDLLETASAYKFASVMSELSEYWFSEGVAKIITEDLENYIISGGVYGTRLNGRLINNEMLKSNKKYLKKRIFMPYSEIKIKYPILEKYKLLTPVFECVRWVELCRKIGKKELQLNLKADYNVKEMLNLVGIDAEES